MTLHPYFILSRTTQNFESYPSFKVFLFQFYEHIKYALTWESINFLCNSIVKKCFAWLQTFMKDVSLKFFFQNQAFSFLFVNMNYWKWFYHYVFVILIWHYFVNSYIRSYCCNKTIRHPSNTFESSHSSVIVVLSEQT